MKKFWLVFALGAVGVLMGCATMIPVGGLYTGDKIPITPPSNRGASSNTGHAV